jgi:hypothetical protein
MGTDLHGFGRGSAMSLEANPVAYSPLARPIVNAGPTLARVAFNSAVSVRPARAGSEIAAGGAGGNGEATLAVVIAHRAGRAIQRLFAAGGYDSRAPFAPENSKTSATSRRRDAWPALLRSVSCEDRHPDRGGFSRRSPRVSNKRRNISGCRRARGARGHAVAACPWLLGGG